MRILLVIPFLILLAPELEACSCAGPGTPCNAAGSSAAVFTGTVLNITLHPVQPLPADSGPAAGRRGRVARSTGDPIPPMSRAFRVIRMEVTEVLSGIAAGQKEIDIVTGLGGGDCGYPFQPGMD